MTESTKNADFRRKPQIFADLPLLLEIPTFGGRRKPQKTADFRRKPQIFAENRRKPQIGLRHLRCVTFSSALGKTPKLPNRPVFAPLPVWVCTYAKPKHQGKAPSLRALNSLVFVGLGLFGSAFLAIAREEQT